jgi:hypothetical protein
MTAQLADEVRFRDHKFIICGINGSELFVPGDYGLNPTMASTACYRGWMSEYAVSEQLILKNLFVLHDAGLPVKNRKPNGPTIRGVEPIAPKSSLGFNCLYKGLDMPLSFTGGILLGRGGHQNLMRNMGFSQFWKFEQVYELIFQEGTLLNSTNKSELASAIREKHIVQGIIGPTLSDEASVTAWVEASFSRHYHS